jgi:GTP cyclohydrolase I
MTMDQRKMAESVRAFLDALDHGFAGDDQDRTPDRVARAWVEDLVSGYAVEPEKELTWTECPPRVGPVIVRGVSFASVCVHHLLPFFGEAHVAYLPHERLAGLSKIGRVVDAHARRLQTQEHLASEIAGSIEGALRPRGVIVLLEALHTCMTLRGVRKERSRMVTSVATGLYEDDPAARAELIGLMTGPGRAAGS